MLGVLVHANALRCIIILILLFSPYVAVNENRGEHRPGELRSIGGIVDYLSASGKEEKIAMEMAIDDCCAYAPLHCGVTLHLMNSGNDPLTAASSGKISSSFQSTSISKKRKTLRCCIYYAICSLEFEIFVKG